MGVVLCKNVVMVVVMVLNVSKLTGVTAGVIPAQDGPKFYVDVYFVHKEYT